MKENFQAREDMHTGHGLLLYNDGTLIKRCFVILSCNEETGSSSSGVSDEYINGNRN